MDPCRANRFFDFVLPNRGERRDRSRDYRAGDGRRLEGSGRQEARHHDQGRYSAFAALFLWLTEDSDYARLHWFRSFRDTGGQQWLGHMMLTAQANFEVPLVFACLVALAIEGIGMYAIMAWLEMRMTGWAHRSGFAAT